MRFAAKGLSVFGILLVIGLVVVGTASSNSSGAPANTAKDGCSCHGPLSGDARATIEAPAEYEPGTTYPVKVGVTGPMALPPPVGQNTGGFALEVTAGTLAGTSGVLAEGQFATHTSSGNDRRSWDLTWTAPQGSAPVTFHLSANAVNGDGQMVQDRWNKATHVANAKAAANTTASSPGPPGEDTPAASVALVGVVLIGLALVRRRL